MPKYIQFSILLVFIFTVGCSQTINYGDDEIVAIVSGTEITIGDIRFLYPDENILEMIDGSVKAELVVQEAKRMNLDVAEEIHDTTEMMPTLPPKNTNNLTEKSIREFAESQAKKLKMEPHEYYKRYVEITTEQHAYMNAYIQKMLGEPELDQIDEYDKKANNLLNELVEKNEDEIQILIK